MSSKLSPELSPALNTLDKIAVIGCGQVGVTFAYALLIDGLAEEIVLSDVNAAKAEGEAMDLQNAVPFGRPAQVRSGSIADCAGAQVVVVTAGAAQKPGETRLDLIAKNARIFSELIPEIARHCPDTILLIVSNPVDALTYLAWQYSGFPPERVIGSGTVLDSGRLRDLLAQRCQVDPRNIHAYIIGEHGDTELPAWSIANIAGIPLAEFAQQRQLNLSLDEIYNQVKNAGYEIIQRKGYTNFAVGLALVKIVESIVRNENSVLTVSSLLQGQMGLQDVCLSLPTIVSRRGVECVLQPNLSEAEQSALQTSAQTLQEAIRSVMAPAS
ncbi:L-lactate dehydrogenase [Leptolyngbya sp. FACHB-261]|uniref:L-lactate dehydrogenase n=1 Tax=Leptolyngbya sp. FACHB-261 TaxID=2692806 RepID=UPI00168846CB|nr:L-lactate dehydrogenase [Leptolyngbya sp. FACHB-261]MBD2103767.1 L-lactate dehydrogenase [Leptolyngbya sp. FACHB-261]